MAGIAVSLIGAQLRSSAAFLAALAAFFLAMPGISGELGIPFSEQFWRSPINVAVMAALVYTSISAPVAGLVFGNRIARFLGEISYSLYLLHWPVMATITMNTDIELNVPLYFATVITLSIAAATITCVTIERPARRAINASIRPTPIIVPA
jgi:peptidoglycan/LPS O-acetylase OafA/YrhL